MAAEDWQKFAYPASEFILYDKLPDKAFSLWQCLCRMVELVFGDGRDGWTETLTKIFHKLVLRHNILVEEVLGRDECRITVHNLIHIKECVHRFGSPDNYWCWVFERAVSDYVNTPTNGRNIEYTYAVKELHKEYIRMKRASKQKQQLQEMSEAKVQSLVVTVVTCLWMCVCVHLCTQTHRVTCTDALGLQDTFNTMNDHIKASPNTPMGY